MNAPDVEQHINAKQAGHGFDLDSSCLRCGRPLSIPPSDACLYSTCDLVSSRDERWTS